jgi:hypothetical protein
MSARARVTKSAYTLPFDLLLYRLDLGAQILHSGLQFEQTTVDSIDCSRIRIIVNKFNNL